MIKQRVNWNEFGHLCEIVKNKIELNNPKIDYIYSIPRGGYPLAVYLSNHLSIPMNNKLSELSDCYLFNSKNILVVDDISCSGKTLEQTLNILSNHKLKTATLHYREGASVKPDFYGTTVPKDIWVVYPFEPINKNMKRDCDK